MKVSYHTNDDGIGVTETEYQDADEFMEHTLIKYGDNAKWIIPGILVYTGTNNRVPNVELVIRKGHEYPIKVVQTNFY